ncbi:hypothetical protein [Paenibacillus oleatilyticus]|uniref:hypothetical protein n=1 Tax=Paenibacillus oleatilyticus TaxID=2594886 RepID=UPI001C1FECE3|nr:hypothetical protein [Paenibacillus oleatilyticus]MBU7316359.1 hypothetical protein [Paenibacillus oleatilyticus]
MSLFLHPQLQLLEGFPIQFSNKKDVIEPPQTENQRKWDETFGKPNEPKSNQKPPEKPPEGTGEEKKNITGETSSTKTGKKVHKQKADERRASGDYDLVNEPLKDKDGKTIEVPKRIDKQGRPSKKTQKAIPDAVQGPPKGNIIDDKPLGRPISKDKQEIRRFINAYKIKYGEPPKQIIIERYDPKTGAPTYDPNDFKIP